MRAAKVQASLRIRAVSPEPPLLAHTSSESRGTFRQKARSLVSLNGWACAVKTCNDGMLEDTNSLDAAHLMMTLPNRNTAHMTLVKATKHFTKIFTGADPETVHWGCSNTPSGKNCFIFMEISGKVKKFHVFCLKLPQNEPPFRTPASSPVFTTFSRRVSPVD